MIITKTKFILNSLSLKQLKDFTNKINCDISTGKLREKFEKSMGTEYVGKIGLEDFRTLVHDLIHDQQVLIYGVFNECFV